MTGRRVILFALSLLIFAAPVMAQGGGTGEGFGYMPAYRFNITPYVGYAWTSSKDVSFTDTNGVPQSGKMDFKSSEMWGLALDIHLGPAKMLQLLYQHQGTDLQFKSNQVGAQNSDIGAMSIDYWQIGGLGGYGIGKTQPYGGMTLGATNYKWTDTSLLPQGVDDSQWKFSIIFNLGAKVFLTDQIALRFNGSAPFTLVGDVGAYFGTGGVGLGGSGIIQWTLSLGLTIALGEV